METYFHPDPIAPFPPAADFPADADASPAACDPSPTRLPAHAPPSSARLRLMVSYGGLIQPRHFDHKLCYSGYTKLLVLERGLRFSAFSSRLASLIGAASPVDIHFKYQLPGEDLDSLVSVTDDEDLDHMLFENDSLPLPDAKHLRLFVYYVGPLPLPPSASFLETPTPAATPTAPAPIQNPPDFLSGPDDDSFVPPPANPLVDEPPPKTGLLKDGEADGSVQGGVPPLESPKIADNNQQQPPLSLVIRRNASEESLSAQTYQTQPDYYLPPPAAVAANWSAASGRFPSFAGGDQAMFLIPAALASGMYPTGMAACQGYYTGQGYYPGLPAEVTGSGGAYAPPEAAATAYVAGFDVAGRPLYYRSAVPAYQTARLNQVDAVINAVKPSQVSRVQS